MKKLITMLVIGLVMGVVGVGNTAQMTVEFNFRTYDVEYPHYLGTTQIFEVYGSGFFTFENVVRDSYDFGHETVTRIGSYDAKWGCTIESLIPDNPYGVAPVNSSSVHNYVYDGHYSGSYLISDTFSERSDLQATVEYSDHGWNWLYEIQLRAGRSFPSKGSTGSEDYAFTASSNLSFWEDFMESGDVVDFGAYFCHGYDGGCLEGQRWYGEATITEVYEHSLASAPAPVPIPATILLLGTGLAGLMVTKRRKKN